jgi:molybdenum cofactor cytidylyltransferase
LAAGSSSRLGRPKQLLPYHGDSLIAHAADTAIESDAAPVVVVLGDNANIISKELDEKKLHITYNDQWQEGMASSLRCGISTVLQIAPECDAVILMVCDQPFVDGELLNSLIRSQRNSGKRIVACQYGDTLGVPALFHRSLFDEIRQVQGDHGAKKIIREHQDELITLPFEKGAIDIDTESDYQSLPS